MSPIIMAVTKLSAFPQGKYTVSHDYQNEHNSGEPQAFKKLSSKGRCNQEQFQVVWTRLAFEVNLSTYDKLVSRTLDRVKSICNLGRSGCMEHQQRQQQQQQQQQLESHHASSNQTIDSLGLPMDLSSKFVGPPRPASTDKRVIFDNLNGYIKSGELSAILGPSGSGKTSLLNALCGRTENYRGRIQLTGAGRGTHRMRLSIIPQKDYLIENLTVKENLMYSSKLLNVGKNFDHEAKILRVVRMLNLSACFESVVANISGGEYKRVSIAQELLRQPDILVLDEPTSGLDSLNCKNLIGSLVELIKASRAGLIRPIAIVMTIHQPDIEVFHMFDHVYCMARGGQVIYDGHPRDAMQVIGSQANLVADPRLSSQLAQNIGNSTNSKQTTADMAQVTTNPANLLIEIASEDLYGREPIERLSRYQLEQFERTREALAWSDPEAPSQMQANLLAANQLAYQAVQVHKTTTSPLEVTPRPDKQGRLSPPMISAGVGANQQRSPSTSPSILSIGASSPSENSPRASLTRDKRLNAKNDHSGLFWYHTGVLAQRAFVSTLRDPLMTLISLLFHLSIPFVMWTVYPQKIGNVHGCPLTDRELDIVSMASEKVARKLEDLQEEVTTTLECSTMFFLTTYSFSMCSLTVAALAFPLNMHILLKEVRNGWYNLPTYVLAKTLANFPFEVLFPVISLVMIYVMLGMPSSAYEWRLWAMAIVMALISMISNTQGLIFGALCMDSVQTAIFLASASSLPQTLLSGFTARIKHMPWLLQRLSWFSQYRYSSDMINMIRFGFDICPCDSSMDEHLKTTKPHFTSVSDSMKRFFIVALENGSPSSYAYSQDPAVIANSTGEAQLAGDNTVAANLTSYRGAVPALMLGDEERKELMQRISDNEVDLFDLLADTVSRSFSFGHKIEDCCSVRSQILVTGGTPKDHYLPLMFGCMFALLILAKVLLFVVVRSKIGNRV